MAKTKEGMNHERFTHLDVFSGIGGFSLAFEAEGFETIGFVECDTIKRIVLKHWWPNVPILGDIRCIIARLKRQDPILRKLFSGVALVTGGVPCQPTSSLGQQRGTADERWLWPEFIRLVCQVRALQPKGSPFYAIAENPPAILTVDGGRIWNGIVSNLVSRGFDCFWDVFPAAAFGAGHLRERVLLVAADSRHPTSPAEPKRECDQVGRKQFSGELLRGITSHNPLREAHGRNGGGLDQAQRGGEGFDTPADSRGQDAATNADSLNTGCATGHGGSEGSEGSEGDKDNEAAKLRCPESVIADTQGEHVRPGLCASQSAPADARLGRGRPCDNGSQTSSHSNLPRLEGHARNENRDGGGQDEKRPTAPADLRGRVFATGPGEPPWWHEANTGVPVLAHGLSNKLVEAATRCTGDAVVPQALGPIARAIRAQLERRE